MNVPAGQPTMLLAKRNATFETMGFTGDNMLVVFESGTLASWQPDRGINQIYGTTAGVCYYLISKNDLDVSVYFAPPASIDWQNIADYKTDSNSWADALQAAHDASGTNGGIIYCPRGQYNMTGLPEVVFTKPVVLWGAGGKSRATNFYTTSTNQTIFSVNIPSNNGFGWGMSNIAMYGPDGSTAGSAIRMDANFLFTIRDCKFGGFYDILDVMRGFYWTIDNCYFDGSKNYMVKIRDIGLEDGGDMFISNCGFGSVTGQPSLIRYESGGGLKISNCKFNGGGNQSTGFYGSAIDMLFAGASSDLLISNTSIENFKNYGIKLAVASGEFDNVGIGNVQFLSPFNTGKCISMNGIKNFTIDGMIANALAGGQCMEFINCQKGKLGTRQISNFTTEYTLTNSTNIFKVSEVAA